MNFKSIKFIFTFLAVILIAACAKDEEVFTGSITGKVTNAVTGEVLSGVTVTLNPTGISKTTGSNGIFEFIDLDPRQYEIQARKNGYSTNSKSVIVVAGRDISGDMQLTPTVEDSKMAISVSSLNFGTKNSSLSFDIINNGNKSLNWNIAGLENIDWLEFSPVTGTVAPGKSYAVQVNLLRNRITERKDAVILIVADNESAAIKITAEVENITSKLSLSTNTLNFGTKSSSLTFDVKNIGNAGDIDWNINAVDVDWIKVSPTVGTTAMGKSSVVKVDVDRSIMTVGEHTTTIIVNADGESQRVTINVTKEMSRYLEISPSALVLGTANSGSIALMSHNGVTAYTIQGHEDSGWIKIDKTSGTIPEYNSSDASTIETINVTVDRTGLAAGEYNVILSVCSDLETVEIPVTMTVDAESTPSTPSATVGEVISCHDDLKFTITDCTISGTTATISYIIENIGNSNINLDLRGASGDRSYIFDDQGNKYDFYNNGSFLSLGTSESYSGVGTTIPEGVKVKGSVVIRNVADNAAIFSNITIWCYSEQSYLIFKNVAIKGRTPQKPAQTQTTGTIVSCSDDLEFTLIDCKRSSSNNVTISYRVKNISNKPIDLDLRGASGGRSYIFDDQGNEYDFYNNGSYLSLGTSESYSGVGTTIPDGVFVNGKVVIKDVDTAATEMANITIYSYSHGSNLVFKNVAIR